MELVSIDSEAQYAVYCTGMSGILPAFQGELVPCGARVGYSVRPNHLSDC